MMFRPAVPPASRVSNRRELAPEYLVDDNGCWIWQRAIDGAGYGKVSRQGRSYGAHVMYWEAANGPIPIGLEPDHKCGVRLCVNVAHMELVTRSENVKRGWDRGGSARRERERASRSAGQRRRYGSSS